MEDVQLAVLCLAGLGILFCGLEVLCDDFLVPSLTALSTRTGLRHDFASATVLALGASAAEIAVSCLATIHGSPDLSVGAITGSGIIAFTLIPALCFIGVGSELRLQTWPLVRDVSIYTASVLVLFWAVRGESFGLFQCVGMFLILVVYLALLMKGMFRNKEGEHGDDGQVSDSDSDSEFQRLRSTVDPPKYMGGESGQDEGEDAQSSSDSDEEYEMCEEFPLSLITKPWKMLFSVLIPPSCMCSRSPSRTIKSSPLWPLSLIVSLACLVGLAELVFALTVKFAGAIGLSHHAAGLTLLALGTQVEDVFACVAMAKHGKPVSAMASAIGSQVYNITVGLGAPFLVYFIVHGKPVRVASKQRESVSFATFLLLLSCAMFLLAALRHLCIPSRRGVKPKISKVDSLILFVAYIVFTGLAVATPYFG